MILTRKPKERATEGARAHVASSMPENVDKSVDNSLNCLKGKEEKDRTVLRANGTPEYGHGRRNCPEPGKGRHFKEES